MSNAGATQLSEFPTNLPPGKIILPQPGLPPPPIVAPNVTAWRYVELAENAQHPKGIYITFIHATERGAGMAYLNGQKRLGLPIVIVEPLFGDFRAKLAEAGFVIEPFLIYGEPCTCAVWRPA